MRNNHDPHGCGCRSSSIRPPTASSHRFRSSPSIVMRARWRRAADRATARSASAISRRSFLVSACGAAATLLAFNAAFAAGGRRGGYYELPPTRAMDMQLARSQLDTASSSSTCRATSSTRPARGRSRCRRARSRSSSSRENKVCEARAGPGSTYLSVPRPRCVHQGRVPRFGYRSRRAVVRAVDAQRRAADHRGGGRHRAHRRADGGHAPHVAARPRESQPGRRHREHGHARRALPGLRVQDLHAVGPRRQRASSSTTTSASRSSKRRASSACATSPCTRDCRSASVVRASTCVDIGRVAKRFPDVNFLIYHSGFVAGKPEGAYDPRAPMASMRW